MNQNRSTHIIETINRLVRTSREMFHAMGHAPSPEQLAERLAISSDKVRSLLKIARAPIKLRSANGN